MGLLVHTSFETREGVPITSVYVRITRLSCDFRGYFTTLTISYESYLNRDKRILGFSPVFAPSLEYRTNIAVPYTTQYGTMEFLYTKVKERLAELGIDAEDVLEDPPMPPPEPEPEQPPPEPEPEQSESPDS